jgi:hypothetical protein
VGGADAQSLTVAGATPLPSASTTTAAPALNAKVESHIKDLHAKLNITPAEETQWSGVAEAMRESANEIDSAIKTREDGAKSATAIADLDAYSVIAQAHADGVKRLAGAFGPLYASMSDDQKKVADGVFSQRAHPEKKIPAAAK